MLSENKPSLANADSFTRAMKFMNSDIHHRGHAQAALNSRMAEMYRKSPVLSDEITTAASNIGVFVTRTDQPGGISMEDAVIHANTVNGIMTGMFILEDVHPKDFPLQHVLLDGAQVQTDEIRGTAEYYSSVADGLVELGNQGLEEIGDVNRRMIDRWLPEVTTGEESHIAQFYAVGFGIAVMGAINVHETIRIEQMKRSDAASENGL